RIDIADQTDSFTRINLVTQRGPPPVVVQVPADSFGQPGHKCFFGLPPMFGFQFAGVDRITMVVSRPVCHIRNVPIMGSTVWNYLIEHTTDCLYHLEVGALVTSANVVSFARLPFFQNEV